jgi:hypothetical protein
MPIHDWTRVDPDIFHALHQSWICEISRALNGGILPDTHYALMEPQTPASPQRMDTDLAFYRRKQDSVAVRREADDQIVARVEIVSLANKLKRDALQEFLEIATAMLKGGINLLVIDGVPLKEAESLNDALWKRIYPSRAGVRPPPKPISLTAYEAGRAVEGFVHEIDVGDRIPDMPLFLSPGSDVRVPLESTYASAFAALPRRWQRVLESSAPPT